MSSSLAFRSGDPDNSGMLTLAELRELLRSADLGLTRLQIHTVLSEADEDESGCSFYIPQSVLKSHNYSVWCLILNCFLGFVAYRKFCGVAASMIYRILDQSLVQERYDIVQSLQQDSELLVHGMDFAMFESKLSKHLMEKDTDNTGSLSREDLRSVLQSCEILFSSKEMMALMSIAVEMQTQQKEVPYSTFLKQGYQVLSHLAIDDKIAAR